MIFNKGGRYIRRNFFYGGEKIETTREYKYLGFLVTPSSEISSGLKDLKDRALRAFLKLKRKMGISFWGILKMSVNNPIENLFMSFCRQLLEVQKQSINDGVLLELGQLPLSYLRRKGPLKTG